MGIFKTGDQVEICCNENGFQNSYFPATIISKINDNDDYIVQYNTLLRDDEQCPLREFRSAVDLRPVPPEITIKGFDVRDEVDAFANDLWWKGTVSNITFAGRKKMYCVKFEMGGGDEAEVAKYWASSLRVHQDWVNGKWLCSKKNNVS